MKKTLKKHLNKKGLTLLEVIITIAIVSIIIPVAFSLLGFGNETFHSGISRRDIQQSVRNISSVIVDKVRYSKDGVVVMDDLPSSYSREENCIYLRIESDGLKGYEKGKDGAVLNLGSEDIDFSKSTISTSSESLKLNLVGESGTNYYDVETIAAPLNGNVSGDIEDGLGVVIKISSKGE